MTLVAVSGCARHIGGQAVPGPLPSTASAPAPDLPKVGQCMNSAEFKALDCNSPHEAEVTAMGEISGLSKDYPDERDLRRAALPPCREALTEYLGSKDADATRLQVWAFWPNKKGWEDGQRWRLCSVIELAPDEKKVSRTGSVKGVLAASGFGTYQLCSSGSPSRDAKLTLTACDKPHVGEAVPGVVALGKNTDPAPSQEDINKMAEEKCTKAVTDYVGSSKRTDVSVAWRTFGSQAWSEGWTNAICYAETSRAFTGRLWGLGDKPLPN
ncbi:hypothetical protein Lesp02_53270 [Lentzea sp. NBRC 105346]|nr:hypothetical protein Lesp02_53270 [Lentzea sp. NBRC 105346]